MLLTAVRNIGRGRVFDENFLMALATVGAWAIGSFDEAVGVMLFYRVGEYFEDRAVERRAAADHGRGRPASGNGQPHRGGRRCPPNLRGGRCGGRYRAGPPGDRVPLDGEVVEGEPPDTSAVTGEPVPVRVATGDRAISGCVNTDGAIKLRVTHVLAESMVQRILTAWKTRPRASPRSTALSPASPACTPGGQCVAIAR